MTVSPPITRARTTHALLIRVGGRNVGAIYKWSTVQRRSMKSKFEVNPYGYGLPADLVPSTLETRSISVDRVDLYDEILEECFGSRELVTLTDQTRPFNLREVWLAPGAATQLGPDLLRAAGADSQLASLLGGSLNAVLTVGSGAGRLYEYRGAYFESINRSASADGDRVSRASGELVWQWRTRLQ